MDSQGNVRAAGRGVQDSGSVLIKLSHRDPQKAVIKKHNSLVLRAESPADKYSWLVRLKRCTTIEIFILDKVSLGRLKRCAKESLPVILQHRYALVVRPLFPSA